jgi:hypothetical protein
MTTLAHTVRTSPLARTTLRIPTESRWLVWGAVVGGMLLAGVSFALSFAGLVAVARWSGTPDTLTWAVPVFIDGAILVYTAATLVMRGRGESTVFASFVLGGFTLVSIAANAAHAAGASAGHIIGDTNDWRTWAGAAIVALAPVAVYTSTHTIAKLVVAPPEVALAHPDQPGPGHRTAARTSGPSTERVDLVGPVAGPVDLGHLDNHIPAGSPTGPLAGPVDQPGPVQDRPGPLEIAIPEAGLDQVWHVDRPQPIVAAAESATRDAAVHDLADQGLSQRVIAAQLGVGKSTVARVLTARGATPAVTTASVGSGRNGVPA